MHRDDQPRAQREHHLLIESQGPWRGPGCRRFITDADALARSGADVWLVLTEDGVAAAVGNSVPELLDLVRHGGRLWIDDFSLQQRALAKAPIVPGHELVGMPEIAEKLLVDSMRVVWH